MLKAIQIMRAKSLAARGDHEGAAQAYLKAGDEAAAAAMFLKAGRHDLARIHFERAGDTAMALEAARAGGDHRTLAELYERQGDVPSAVQCLLRANDVAGAIRLCLDRGLKADAAEIYIERGQKREAARLLVEARQFDRAIALYREAGDVERMVATYLARGEPASGAAECLAGGETLAAAVLFEAAGDHAGAATAYRDAGRMEKAAELFAKAGDHASLGEVRLRTGRLDLATEAFAKVEGRELETARLYARLVVLDVDEARNLDAVAVCGAVSASSDALALGLASRHVLLASRTLETRWEYRLSGEMSPASVALSPDGSRVAIGTDGPLESGSYGILVLDANKEPVLQQECEDAPRRIVFAPDGLALLAVAGDRCHCLRFDDAPGWASGVDFKARALDVSGTGDLVAVGSIGGRLYLLDAQGREVASAEMGDRVQALRFDAAGQRLAALVGDSRLVITDLSLATLHESRAAGPVRALECLPGGQNIALAVGDRVAVYDWEACQLSETPCGGPVVSLFPDMLRLHLMATTEDQRLVVLKPRVFMEQAADFYTRAGDLEAAAAIYEQIEVYDKAYDLFRQLGEYEKAARVVFATGDVVRAARHYEVVGHYTQAAKMYEGAGDLSQAARSYGRSGDTRRAAEIYEGLGDLILAADFYEQSGDFKKAAALFRQTMQKENAVSNYEAWLALHGDDRGAKFELGLLYAEDGRHDDAIRMLQQLTDDPDFRREALRATGECFLAKGLPDVAINRFQEAIGENAKPGRDNIDLFYHIGCAHEAAERYEQATEVFGKVMAIDYYFRDVQERLHQTRELSVLANKADAFMDLETEALATADAPAPPAAKPGGYERYRIVRKLGQGGMGVVYLALDERLNRQVAWKVLPSHLSADAEFQQRLLREARAVAKLQNTHIVAIYDIVTDPKECYITMEFIDGGTLRQKLRQTPKLPTAEACRYGMEIAEALAVAHDAGIAHRDVKPENIMITAKNNQVKMVDFGLARLNDDQNLTREGVIAGTLAYMAPEQIRAEATDHRVDIYALGIILFEMMAGRMPFSGDNVLGQHLHADIPDIHELRPDAPEDYVALVNRCLAKDRDERVRDAREVIAVLKPVLSAVAATQTTIFEPGRQ